MRIQLAAALLLGAVAGCTLDAPKAAARAPRGPWIDGGHRYRHVDAAETIVLVRESDGVFLVESCTDGRGAPCEPPAETLERLSLQLDSVIKTADKATGGSAALVIEHPLRKSVREASGDGFGDVLVLVPLIMGPDCPDPAVRTSLVGALVKRPELGPEAQLALARAILALDATGSLFLLHTLAARPDVTEATLAVCLEGVANTNPRLARPILLRALEHGLSPALREPFLAATRSIESDDERTPLVEAFAKALLDPPEQLALVKEATTLRSGCARRILVRLLANPDVTDDAVATCVEAAPGLVDTKDTKDVLLAALATGRATAVRPVIQAATRCDERATREAVADAALALEARDEATQVDLVALLAGSASNPGDESRRFEKLAASRGTTERTKALIVAKAPDPVGVAVLARMKLDDDRALEIVQGGIERRSCVLLDAVLKARPTAPVREKIRAQIDDLPQGEAREKLWRTLIETADRR